MSVLATPPPTDWPRERASPEPPARRSWPDQFAMTVEVARQIVGGQHALRPEQRLAVRGAVDDLPVTTHRSQTPRTNHRTGEFFAPTICRAPAPSLVRITRSSRPAPRLSMA